MIVIDASAFVEYLLRTPRAAAVRRGIVAAGRNLHAPHLVDIEVAQTVRRLVAALHVSDEDGRGTLIEFAGFPMQQYPHTSLLPRIWHLRHNLTAYDASYVALAELLGAPLLTCDARIAAAPGHNARIELV